MYRLIHNGDIELIIPQRETRNNQAPIAQTYIAINDTIGKSPVYYARNLWNKLSVESRNVENIETFKANIRHQMYDAYVAEEMARLTAVMFL